MRRLGLAMVTVTLALHGCDRDTPRPGAGDLSPGRVDLSSAAGTSDLTAGPCMMGTACSGRCVDLATDRRHCGACGFECPLNVACVSGHCTGCLPGFTICNEACVYLLGDPRNCGACGRVCKGGMVCSDGVCM
jgi:Stigma-specific protein, Stig1